MKRHARLCLPCCLLTLIGLTPVAQAETDHRAVLAPHQEIGGAYMQTEHFKGVALNTRLSLPLSRYMGAVFIATANDVDGKKSGFNGSNTLAVGGALFLRDYERSALGLSYTQSHVNYDAPSTTPSQNDHTYGVSASYYLGDFTLVANRTLTRGDSERNSLSYGGYWYPNANIRIGAAKYGMDNAGLYSFSLTAQPEFLGGNLQPSFTYQTRFEGDALASIGLTYCFQKGISLKERNRRY